MSEIPKFRPNPEEKPNPLKIQKKFNSDVSSIDSSDGLTDSALAESRARKDFRIIKLEEN